MKGNNSSSSDYDSSRDRWNGERAHVPEEVSHAYPRSARSSLDEQRHPVEAQQNEGDHESQSSSRPYPHQDLSRMDGEILGRRGHSAESSDPVEGEDQDGPEGEAMSDDDNLEDDESEENEEGSSTSKDNNSTTTKSEEGSDSLVIAMYGARRPAVKVRSMFVDKLFKMVEDPAIQHLISWAKEGDMFYVYNCIKLSDTILPKFFKHNNWQSFVRQLNMYGFHKIYRYDREESNMNRKNPETQRWQFYHPHFQRDFPHLRKNIKRKSARSMNTAPATSRIAPMAYQKGSSVRGRQARTPGSIPHNRRALVVDSKTTLRRLDALTVPSVAFKGVAAGKLTTVKPNRTDLMDPLANPEWLLLAARHERLLR
ncbi:hypothetical protein EC968_004311 [Mortierella alpina]|nr:hypothetical protein EC968_004311 [Mortierella alpina]